MPGWGDPSGVDSIGQCQWPRFVACRVDIEGRGNGYDQCLILRFDYQAVPQQLLHGVFQFARGILLRGGRGFGCRLDPGL